MCEHDEHGIANDEVILGDEITGAEMRQCVGTKTVQGCSEWKLIDKFYKRKTRGKICTYYICLDCHREYTILYNKKYYNDNREREILRVEKYNNENKDKIKIQSKVRYLNKKENGNFDTDEIKEYQKQYYKNHKEEISEKNKKKKTDPEFIEKRKAYYKKRSKNDPAFKLRNNISSIIRNSLKKQNKNKNKQSFLSFVLYTTEELETYLESIFEPWMTWENYGKYNVETWKDEDQSTWTWNIDHIIPQSDLPFTSMEDENFKKCWALENIRPYSAKLNAIEGAARTRHQNKSNVSELK